MDALIKLYQFFFLRRIVKLAKPEDRVLVDTNTLKHMKVMGLMLLLAPFALFVKLAPLFTNNPLVTKLIGTIDATNFTSIIMVTGTAWFMVSFGAIPKYLEDVAMEVTFWMFSAFVLSSEWLVIGMAIDSPVSAPFLFLIYWGLYNCAVQYDTMDALKAGLDEAQLRFARLGRAVFMRQVGGEAASAIEAGKEPPAT